VAMNTSFVMNTLNGPINNRNPQGQAPTR
jgi:hypothetical protein